MTKRAFKTPVPPAMDGFEFKQRVEPINWRTIASLQVDTIVKNVDVACLQSVVDNLTFCNVDSQGLFTNAHGKDFDNLDSNFLKIFKCSQLIMEYLLHSQDYILENRNQIKSQVAIQLEEIQQLKDKCNQKEENIQDLKKDLKSLKKTLYAYQLMAKMPGGIGENAHASVATYHRCDYCPKVFNSGFHLESHLYRRHGDKLPELKSKNVLKESNQNDEKIQAGSYDLQKITETVEHFSTRVIETERQFRKELEDKMESKLADEIKRRELILEQGYQQERLKYTQEIQQLKSTLHSELNQEKMALEEQRRLIEKFMNNNRPSTFGKIEDDEDSLILQNLSSKTGKISQEDTIKSMNMDLDLDQKKQSVSISKEYILAASNDVEFKRMENKLNVALEEINILQNSLINERKKNVAMDQEDKVPKRTSSPTQILKTVKTVSKKTSIIESDSIADIWNQILNKLKLFTEISNPETPWTRTLYPHKSRLEIMKMRKILEEDLKQALESSGIDENYVTEKWGEDPNLEEHVFGACRDIILRSEDHAVQDPLFGKMRSLVERDLDNMLGVYYKLPTESLKGNSTHPTDENNKHRRATSEPKKRIPPTLPSINTKKNVSFANHSRSNSTLSMEAIQQKIADFTRRKRNSSETSSQNGDTPQTPNSAKYKKKLGFKKAFKKLIGFNKQSEKGLPSPPVKNEQQDKGDILYKPTDMISEVESSEDPSRATSASEPVDYSNPKRQVVYDTSRVEESTVLESITEVSEISSAAFLGASNESLSEITNNDTKKAQEQTRIEPLQIIEEEVKNDNSQIEVVNFSDEDTNNIPAQWPVIEAQKEKEAPKQQIKQENSFISSEASFNLSELSDITETTVDPKVPSSNLNFSDEEDEDESMIKASVNIIEKSNILPTVPAEDENSLDISELLDHFSNQIKPEKTKGQYDDEFDIDEIDL